MQKCRSAGMNTQKFVIFRNLEEKGMIACGRHVEKKDLTKTMSVWPSGLRRCFQAPVHKGVGSKPIAVIQDFLQDCFEWLRESI